MSTLELPDAPPLLGENIAMADSASTAGQQAAARTEGTQPANDNGTSENEPIQSYTPDDKKREVLRIKSLAEWAHYEVLDLPETATRTQIETAYREKARLTHTDRNSDRDAKEVFQRVLHAKETLVDPERRRTSDRERSEHLAQGDPIRNDLGEEFAENAYDEDEDNSDIDEDDEPQPMSEAKKRLLERMGPLVERVLMSGEEEAYKELEKLEKEMKKLNKQENEERRRNRQQPIPVGDRTPPLLLIQKAGESRRIQLAILNDPNQDTNARENANREYESKKEGLKTLLEHLQLPPWVNSLPNPTAPSTGSQPSSAGNRQTSNPRTAAGSSTDQSSDAMDTTHDWTAGETTKGERILAVRSIKFTGRSVRTGELDQLYKKQDFVVEERGSNSMKILTASEVGYDAVKAYNQLSGDQRWEIAGIEKRFGPMDRERLGDSIQAVAWDPNTKAWHNRPWTLAKINIDGTPRVVNLSTLRSVLPKREADKLVDDFAKENNPDAPWLQGQHGTGRQIEDSTRRFERRDWQGRDRGERQMLPERQEYDDYGYLEERPFPRGGRERISGNFERLRNRDNRPYQSDDQMRDAALNISNEPHRTNGAHRQRPPPVRAVPSAPLSPPTRTTDTLPGNVREEPYQTSAAAGGQFVTQEQHQENFQMMMQKFDELAIMIRQAQGPVAAAR